MVRLAPGSSRATLAVVGICLTVASCSSATPGAGQSTPATGTPTSSETSWASSVVASSTLQCAAQIGTEPPADDLRVVAGVVALPAATTAEPLQAVPRSNDSTTRFYAKRGLVIKTSQTFELIVPPAQRDHLAIGWGDFTQPTWRLRVSCNDTNATWLSFAGGYFTTRRECISLIVRAHGQRERVHIGIGARCRTR